MNFQWLFQRLRTMSGPEIIHRFGEGVRRKTSRHQVFGWEKFKSPAALKKLTLFSDPLRLKAGAAFQSAIAAAKQDLLAGHFKALGQDWPVNSGPTLFPPERWRIDPVSNRLWPGAERYCFDIEYRHVEDFGDVKYVWEINRLVLLQPLSLGFALAHDGQALQAACTMFKSWMQANPPFQGLAWNSGIELAMRTASIALFWLLCGEALEAESAAQVQQCLRAHHYWLERFPSRYSSANNHLLGELMGRFICECLIEDPQMEERVKRTAAAIAEQAALQFFPDGINAEQSLNYGAYAAEMLLMSAVIARLSHIELPGVEQRLLAFAASIGWFSDALGHVPLIGDDDAAHVLWREEGTQQRYVADVARAICGFYQKPCDVVPATEVTGATQTLLGLVCGEPRQQLAPPVGLRSFLQGGYTLVRQERAGRNMLLSIDHGPLGYLSIAAHGHADAGAVTLNLDDQPVLIDPGTYLYHSGGAWRDWFRSSQAHNTLTISGRNQSEITGPFMWGLRATGHLDLLRQGVSWQVVTSHDGYVQDFAVSPQRSVTPVAHGLSFADRLKGALKPLAVLCVWQFAPGFTANGEGQDWLISPDKASGINPDLTLRLRFSLPGEVKAVCGEAGPEGGWASPQFGERVPALKVSWQGVLGPDTTLETLLTWGQA